MIIVIKLRFCVKQCSMEETHGTQTNTKCKTEKTKISTLKYKCYKYSLKRFKDKIKLNIIGNVSMADLSVNSLLILMVRFNAVMLSIE